MLKNKYLNLYEIKELRWVTRVIAHTASSG